MGKDEMMKKSIFKVLDKIKFSGGDPHLSQNIDVQLYGKKKKPKKQRPAVRGLLKGKRTEFSEKDRVDTK
jgi:hypothetical protein